MDDNFEQQFMQNVKASAAQGQGQSQVPAQDQTQLGPSPVISSASVPPTGNFQPTNVTGQSTVTPSVVAVPRPTTSQSPLALVVAIILGIIVILESIALIVAIANYPTSTDSSSLADEENADTAEVSTEYSESSYRYSDSGDLVAFSGTCNNSEGATLKLNKENTYSKVNPSGATTESGNYEITRGNIISTSNGGVMYYDGYSVADGLNIYNCELETVESSTE